MRKVRNHTYSMTRHPYTRQTKKKSSERMNEFEHRTNKKMMKKNKRIKQKKGQEEESKTVAVEMNGNNDDEIFPVCHLTAFSVCHLTGSCSCAVHIIMHMRKRSTSKQVL